MTTYTPNTSNDDDTGVLGLAAASAVDDGNASSGRINPPMTPSQQITAPSPLQRAPSVTSTHGHSNGGRGVGGTMSFTNNTNGTTMASFPASPAVSTLSKYSSSGSSSLASANNSRMSVDDILGNSKLSLEGRRRRRSRERPGATVVTGGKDEKVKGGIRPSSAAEASMQPSSGGGKKVGLAGNTDNATSRSTNANEQSPSSAAAGARKKKRPRPDHNPGREERKRRLEHLQREQLLRQRLGGGQRQQVGAKKKRRASNDIGGLNKLERMKSEESEEVEDVPSPSSSDRLERRQQQMGGEPQTLSAGSHIDDTSQQADNVENATTAPQRQEEQPPSNKPTPRRSKRARAISSYNVAELSKNSMSEIPLSSSSPSSPDDAAVAKHENNGNNSSPPPPQPEEEADEPQSAESALSALLSSYDACIGQNTTPPQSSSSIATTPSSSKREAPSSPWDVVQNFLSVLQYVNLNDRTYLQSGECKRVERELGNSVLKSVERVKCEVVNRNSTGNNNEDEVASKKDGEGEEGDDKKEDVIRKREGRLLRIIEIQIWIRMMVWTLEQENGLDFLQRAIESSSEGDTKVASGGQEGGKRGKKKKKKKAKKSRQQQSINTTTVNAVPRQCLLDELKTLMELVPYVLPPSIEFASWVKDELTFGHRQSLPDYGMELFDHFEIEVVEPIALRRGGSATGDDDDASSSRRSGRSEVSRSPVKRKKERGGGSGVGVGTGANGVVVGGLRSPTRRLMERRQDRQRAYFASLAEEEEEMKQASAAGSNANDDESATITGSLSTAATSTSKASSSSREKDDTELFKTSVSLVTSKSESRQSSNPFLKGSARGEYVGSHLGTKLSNITSLFREVKARPTPRASRGRSKATKMMMMQPAAEETRRVGEQQQMEISVGPAKATSTTTTTTITAASMATQQQQSKKNLRGPNARSLPSSTSSFPPTQTPRKRLIRPAVASSRGSRPSALSTFRGVEETPRPIVDETPAKRTRLRLGDDQYGHHHHHYAYMNNPIVDETPTQPQRQQQSMRGAPWYDVEDDPVRRQRSRQQQSIYQSDNPTRRLHHQQQQQQQQHRRVGNNNNSISTGVRAEQHLTPINRTYNGLGITTTTAPPPSLLLSYGMSPMPHGEDMESAVAKAADAARKKRR